MKTYEIKKEVVTEEIKILPCPFCGNDDISINYYAGDYGYRGAEACLSCKQCGASGATVKDNKYSLSKSEHIKIAISKWNRRTEPVG